MPVPRPCRVLVVDDHPDAAESLALVIGALGHGSRFLTDPKQVEQFVGQFRPHVLLLDIAMPDIDGWTLAQLLRAQYGQEALKIVAITAFGTADAHARSRRAGFDAHVVKPIDPDLVNEILEQCFAEPMRR